MTAGTYSLLEALVFAPGTVAILITFVRIASLSQIIKCKRFFRAVPFPSNTASLTVRNEGLVVFLARHSVLTTESARNVTEGNFVEAELKNDGERKKVT